MWVEQPGPERKLELDEVTGARNMNRSPERKYGLKGRKSGKDTPTAQIRQKYKNREGRVDPLAV